MAREYAESGLLDPSTRVRQSETDQFIVALDMKVVTRRGLSAPVVMHLKSLSLCGLDLDSILTNSSYFSIDFNALQSLTLESCAGLEHALPKLMGPDVVHHETLGALRLETFILRHECPYTFFAQALETFLLSLRPLKTLHILLENPSQACLPFESLKHHGKTLQSLIWDERRSPRSDVSADTSRIPDKFFHLKYIARYCTKLRALGITLDWEILASSDKIQQEVRLSYKSGIQRCLMMYRFPHTFESFDGFKL